MKKALSVLLALCVLILSISVFGASAAENAQTVYFELTKGAFGDDAQLEIDPDTGSAKVYVWCVPVYGNTNGWNDVKLYGEAAKCMLIGETDDAYVFAADLSAYGRINDFTDYSLSFYTSANHGYETVPVSMTSDCLGDTLYLTGETRPSKENVNKSLYAAWKAHGELCGAVAEITGTGEIAEGKWYVNKPKAQIISDALAKYLIQSFTNSVFCKPEKINELCQYFDVKPCGVFKSYLSGNADLIKNGEAYEATLRTKDGEKTVACIKGFDKHGEPIKIAAPSYVKEVLGLSDKDASEAVSAVSGCVIGDVDRDGYTDIKDATLIQKHAAKMIALDSGGMISADVDFNGSVEIGDATEIQKIIAHVAVG